LNEIGIMGRLDHPHIVKLVGTYCQGKDIGILMYPAAACDLATYMDELEGEPLSCPLRQRLKLYLFCLSNALAFLHTVKIRHKDIKPKNILIDKNGCVLLTDFGISRDFTDDEQSETAGSTPRTYKYCAPEVAEGENRGRAADVFSLGCVFLEMVTVIAGKSLDELQRSFGHPSDCAYHNNLAAIRSWLLNIHDKELETRPAREKEDWRLLLLRLGLMGQKTEDTVSKMILQMLAESPDSRPSAAELDFSSATSDFCPLCDLQHLRCLPPASDEDSESTPKMTERVPYLSGYVSD